VPARADEAVDAIAEQLRYLERKAEYEQRRKRRHRQVAEILNVAIGLPAAILAGAATLTALEYVSTGLVATLAGLATILSTAHVFLRLAHRASYNRTLEAEFGRLANDAKRVRDIELALHAGDDAWIKGTPARLEKFDERFAKLSQRAPLEE
jgi:hypothetical protein